MKHKPLLGLILVVLLAIGIGANPRFIEELKIGGGFESTPDGGADFEKDGDIFTDGAITAAGFSGDGSALTNLPIAPELLDLALIDPLKGALLVGDGAAWNDLPAGADGHHLEADSTEALGLTWSAEGGFALPVDDTTALVRDPGDPTKQMRIDTGAIAASATRVLAMPDQDIDLAPDTGTFQGADPATAKTDTAQEWTRAQNFDATLLTDAATIAWNAALNQVASVTLGGNRTLADPTNLTDGGAYILIVKQDGTGGRTLAFDSAYKWPGGTAPTLSSAPNAVDIITFISDEANLYGVVQHDFQ